MTVIVLLVLAWMLVGIALGVWRIDAFLRRLDAAFPDLEPHHRFHEPEYCMLVLWAVAWPWMFLVDGWLTRRALPGEW